MNGELVGDMNLGSVSLLALPLLKGNELPTVDLVFSALWYECSCNTWLLLLGLDVFISDVITVLAAVEINAKLLWTLDEGDGRHWDELSLCFWFTNVVGSIDCGGKDIVTVLECIWDPSLVVNCIIGWVIPSIFSNCAVGIFITTGCGMVVLDTNKLVAEVIKGLACITLPTVSVAYLVAATAAAYLVTGGVDVVFLVTTGGESAILLLTRGGSNTFLLTRDPGTVVLATWGTGAVFLVTRGAGDVNIATGCVGIVIVTFDIVEVMDVVVEFIHCVLAELTVTAGFENFVVKTSFFTATSFGCFTTFLVVTAVDAKT